MPRLRNDVGSYAVRVQPLQRALPDARVCVLNRGQRPVDVLGQAVGNPDAELPPATPQRAAFMKLRADYASAPHSWLSFAPTAARRFPLVKAAFLGPWALWAALAVLLALCAGCVVYAARVTAR
jgi:hypothetical protein